MEVSPLKKGVNGLTEVVPNYANTQFLYNLYSMCVGRESIWEVFFSV